jgi:uncharacterized membrane protein YdjX (TVP38/TMEM64 family)
MDRRRALKIALALALVAGVAAIWFSPLREHLTREEIRAAAAGLRGYWYGPIAFILIFAVSCVLGVPASVFVLASGAIWGWKWGGFYALTGGLIGATISFLIGRFMGEGLLDRFGHVGKMVSKQVDHAGFKSLLLLRFVPGIPFAALNYGAGTCGVKLGDFVLATFLGSAPSILVFAYCADALLSGTMSNGEAVQRMLIVGALMIALVLLPGFLKKRLAPQPR